jgi:hypothetical protein
VERDLTSLFSDELPLPRPGASLNELSAPGGGLPEPVLGSIEISRDDDLPLPPGTVGAAIPAPAASLETVLGAAPIARGGDTLTGNGDPAQIRGSAPGHPTG